MTGATVVGFRDIGRLRHWTFIYWRPVGQRCSRDLRNGLAALFDVQATVGGHLANADGVQIPFVENPLDLAFAPFLDHEQHALLRFGQHDFVRRHARLTLRHRDTSIAMPDAPTRPISHVEQVKPAAPMS